MLKKPLTAVSCLALLTASGCIVVDDPGPDPYYNGTLDTIVWLDGSDDPSLCSYYDVSRVDVVVYDANDDFVVDAQPTCEELGVAFDLPAGTYYVDVTLLGPGGSAKSDTVSTGVDVYREELTELIVDFPDASIYY